MKKFNNLRISTRLVISMTALVMLLVITISTVITYKMQQTLQESAKTITQESASHHAYALKAELEIALDEVRSLGNAIETMLANTHRDVKLSYQEVNDVLKYLLEQRPRFFGIKLALESRHAGDKNEIAGELGYNSNGQFAPHWIHDTENHVNLQPLTGYETASWYQLPQKNLRESIIDPTPYITPQGEHVSLIALAVPLKNRQNQFMGTLAIDIMTKDLQNMLLNSKVGNFKGGNITFYSDNGTVVVSKLDSAINKNIRDITTQQEFIDKVFSDKFFFTERYSDDLKQQVFSYGAPAEIGNTGLFWMVVVSVVEDELMEGMYELLLFTIISGIIGILVAILMIYWFSRNLSKSFKQLIIHAQAIAAGNLQNTIHYPWHDEVGQLFSSFATMQTQLSERTAENKLVMEKALRINQALDNAATGIIIVDKDFKIIYLNEAATHLFTEHEVEIRKVLPHFNAERLLGAFIDVLHQNPAEHRRLLQGLTTVDHEHMVWGNLYVDVNIMPIINHGEHLGWIKEFTNRTLEVAIEIEVNEVMHAALQGDFTQRITLSNKHGFFKALGEALNQTLEYNQQIISELVHVFAAVSKGDLTQTVTSNYSGSLEKLKADVNATVATPAILNMKFYR